MAELSNKLKSFLSRELQREFTSLENSLVLFIAQTNDETAVSQSLDEENIVRRQILTAKLLTDSQVALMIPRVNWTSGVIYDDYDSSENLATKNFYVYTDEGNVYICVQNGGGRRSIDKPIGTSTGLIYQRNGYVWKFMYKVPRDLLDFVDDNYLPIRELTVYQNKPYAYSDDQQLQYAVQYDAVAGEINQIKISSAGSEFVATIKASENHKVQQATTNTIKLDARASGIDDTYNNYTIRIVSGPGVGQFIRITDYNGSTKTATLATTWSTLPTSTSYYEIIPSVDIDGDGSGASAYVKMSTYTAKTIDSVVINTPGSNYTYANASILPTVSTQPVLTPIVSPSSGLGYDQIFDLFVKRVSILVKMRGTEGGKAILGNDYKKYGLWFAPRIGAGYDNEGSVVGKESYTRTKCDISGNFTDDYLSSEYYVFGISSYAAGKIADTGNSFIRYSPSRAQITVDGLDTNFKLGEGLVFFTGLDSGLSGYTFSNKVATVINTLYADSTKASSTDVFRCTHKLNVARNDGSDFDAGTPYIDIPYDSGVTGASGSVGLVADFRSEGGASGTIYLTNVIHNSASNFGFVAGETLETQNLDVSIESVSPPELNLYSGQLLYITSVDSVTRNSEQLDLFKINFDF